MQRFEPAYEDVWAHPCRARFGSRRWCQLRLVEIWLPQRLNCAGPQKNHNGHQLKRSLWVVVLGLGLVLLFRFLKIKIPKLGGPEARPQRHSGPADCQPVSSNIYRRPDPLIYDQYYLMAQGIAVSWDNPDIHVEQNGQLVDPHELQPGATYEVIARVWNSSTDAPVAQLPVQFSYLSFGVGTESHPIASGYVDLGVKGSADCPAFVSCSWTTPSVPGHYCLQVDLQWFDDANPANNLGQQNTDVQPLNSPNAQFTFLAANTQRTPSRLTFRADAYTVPAPGPCGTGAEAATLRNERVASQKMSMQTLPEGWTVTVTPSDLVLEPASEQTITVDVVAPDGFSGQQGFNVNAFAGESLVGGLTLIVHS
jgi:hypothetical protein